MIVIDWQKYNILVENKLEKNKSWIAETDDDEVTDGRSDKYVLLTY